jgi:hypothetical protein
MLSSQTAPARPSGGTENSGAFTMAKAIAKAANIQESDAEYLNILAKNINSPMKLAEEMSALVASRASKPTPTPAQSPSPVAKPIVENPEALMREYQSKVIALRGNKRAIEEVQEEYSKKGVPIGEAVFTIK